MFFLFCLWFLLQIALNAGECSINCRNSTSSGNSCCICEIFVYDAPCIAKCIPKNAENCCRKQSRDRMEELRQHINKLANYRCLGCRYYEHIPSGECMSCPVGCASCYNNTLCYECVNGMYGKICSEKCGKCRPDNQGVVKCDSDSGKCTNGCVDGYYSPRCDHACGHCKPDNQGVVKCDSDSGKCTNGCVDGYYSPRCDHACGHCKPDNQGVVKCDIDSGTCTNGCVDGYYSPRCDHVCGHCKPSNQGVVKCDSETCTNGCIDGYYSDRCDRVCSGTCSKRACSQHSGFCDNGCVFGWYGDTCNKTCSDTCSLSSCNQKSGFCENGCVSGWHGDKCEESCSNTCFNRTCDQYTGYCAIACFSGWYGDTCNEICSDTCSLSFCNRISGFCENGCVSGWHGDTCGDSCSSTCYNKSCDQFSGYCSNGCASGWYGDTCNKTCSDTCSLNYCNQRSGFCEKGCVSGWHGDTCEESCSDTCFLRSCNQKSGFCEKGCVSGWHSDMCNLLCSSTCYSKSCDQYSGRCYNGCASAYYGDTCRFKCVDTCKERACDRQTSQCLRGCVTGYQGAFCNMTMNIGPDSVLVGFTSSLAGVIVLLVITLITWIIRRVVRGKRYGNLQVSTRDTSAHIYDEITTIEDTTVVHRVSSSHSYMEVGTAHTHRSIYESVPNTRSNFDSEIAIAGNWTKALADVETINDTQLVCANAHSMSTLYSEVSNYNKSDVIHTSSFVSLDNAEVHRKSSNRSRKYYEIPDLISGINHNIKIERSDTSDGHEIPVSSVSSTAQNAEAGGASLSGQCNTMTDFATSSTRDSKVKQNKNLVSSRNNEKDFSDINQTLQKAKDKRNSSSSGFDIDIPLKTHQTQEKVTEGDSASLNYIHPVN